MSSARDALRTAALKARSAKSKIVKFEEIDYEVRAPSVEARGNIIAASGAMDSAGKAKRPGASAGKSTDVAALQIAAVINCTFVPGTDELVFEQADYARLAKDPSGGITDALGTAALEFLNAATDAEAAKND